MTMRTPATITIDPYEEVQNKLNQPPVELTIDDLDEEEEVEVVTADEVKADADETPNVPDDWQQKFEQLQAENEVTRKNLEAVAPYVQRINDARAKETEEQTNLIVAKLDEVSETSSNPLSDADRTALKDAIQSAIEYTQVKPEIQQTMQFVEAMRSALAIVGQGATVKEFLDMGNKLLTYSGKGGMQAYAEIYKDLASKSKTVEMETQRQTRSKSGVDNPPTTPVQSGGSLRTINDFEKQIAYHGLSSLNDKQRGQYMRLRKQSGLD